MKNNIINKFKEALFILAIPLVVGGCCCNGNKGQKQDPKTDALGEYKLLQQDSVIQWIPEDYGSTVEGQSAKNMGENVIGIAKTYDFRKVYRNELVLIKQFSHNTPVFTYSLPLNQDNPEVKKAWNKYLELSGK